MSDTFDHETDAYESYWNADAPGAFGNDDTYSDKFEYFKHPKTYKCKFCGKENLEWSCTDTGWRLKDRTTNQIHRCAEYGGV